MNLTYRKAAFDDIDILTKTRIQVLRAANELEEDADMSAVEKETYDYYLTALKDGSHSAFLVFDRGIFVGAYQLLSCDAHLSQYNRKKSLYHEHVYSSGLPEKGYRLPCPAAAD